MTRTIAIKLILTTLGISAMSCSTSRDLDVSYPYGRFATLDSLWMEPDCVKRDSVERRTMSVRGNYHAVMWFCDGLLVDVSKPYVNPQGEQGCSVSVPQISCYGRVEDSRAVKEKFTLTAGLHQKQSPYYVCFVWFDKTADGLVYVNSHVSEYMLSHELAPSRVVYCLNGKYADKRDMRTLRSLHKEDIKDFSIHYEAEKQTVYVDIRCCQKAVDVQHPPDCSAGNLHAAMRKDYGAYGVLGMVRSLKDNKSADGALAEYVDMAGIRDTLQGRSFLCWQGGHNVLPRFVYREDGEIRICAPSPAYAAGYYYSNDVAHLPVPRVMRYSEARCVMDRVLPGETRYKVLDNYLTALEQGDTLGLRVVRDSLHMEYADMMLLDFRCFYWNEVDSTVTRWSYREDMPASFYADKTPFVFLMDADQPLTDILRHPERDPYRSWWSKP